MTTTTADKKRQNVLFIRFIESMNLKKKIQTQITSVLCFVFVCFRLCQRKQKTTTNKRKISANLSWKRFRFPCYYDDTLPFSASTHILRLQARSHTYAHEMQ